MSKNISKKNEQKLKLYLEKKNDTQPGNTKAKKNSVSAQNDKNLSGIGIGAGVSKR